MNPFTGAVFHGEVEQDSFYLTQVKHISTASSLSMDQLTKLIAYLDVQGDSCTITVNDQIPLLLSMEEIKALSNDLEMILKQIQIGDKKG